MRSRATLYVSIQMLTTLQQGLKPSMNTFEMVQLGISIVLSGLIVYRAYIDQSSGQSLPLSTTPKIS